MKAIKRRSINLLYRSGIPRQLLKLQKKNLTVLNYHRVGDPDEEKFDSFKPNISATRKEFANQMDYLSRWFNVVSYQQVLARITQGVLMPDNAALITFDDGYLDNYENAFPILEAYKFPAMIFLTTGHIENDVPFMWDLVAYCLNATEKDSISFPEIGFYQWNNQQELDKCIRTIVEKIKRLSKAQKEKILNSLPDKLNVTIPANYFRDLMMTWEQIRDLASKKIEFGGHTISHPILSKVDPEIARKEILGSKTKIEAEISREITSFAYPNGQEIDFNQETIQIVAQAGYKTAFSLIDGKYPYARLQSAPYEIRRIFISHKDSIDRFAVKVSGIPHPF